MVYCLFQKTFLVHSESNDKLELQIVPIMNGMSHKIVHRIIISKMQ